MRRTSIFRENSGRDTENPAVSNIQLKDGKLRITMVLC